MQKNNERWKVKVDTIIKIVFFCESFVRLVSGWKMTGIWSERNEETARQWARSVIILKWLHYQVAMFYQKVDKYLGIPAFFFSCAIGTSLVGAAGTEDGTVADVITWICAGVSFVTAGLLGVLFYLDPGTLSQRHLDKSVDFDDIYHDLQLELSMNDTIRQDPGWFLQFVQRKIAVTQKKPPVIPARFWEQKAVDVVNGHLARDLKEMESYMNQTFGKSNIAAGGESSWATQAAPMTIHEELAKTDGYGRKVRDFARKETITFSSGKGQDVEVEMECSSQPADPESKNEEEHDHMDGLALQDELQKEMRKLRTLSKQKRYEYQMQRFDPSGENLND